MPEKNVMRFLYQLLRRLYLYKKRNKYMSRAMEEFIRLTVGDEKFEEIQNGV